MNSSPKTAKRSRTSQQSRSTTAVSAIRFGRPKPTREIKPSEIHELRMQTLRVQNQIKLQQTQLNRLKEKILAKTEAINRTVKQKSNEQSATGHQSAIDQLQRSIDGAENTLRQLRAELDEAQMDDRTAYYQELEEELKATFLEYERIQRAVQDSKQSAQDWEAQLRDVDRKASVENLGDLRQKVAQVKAVNAALRDKWYAYQLKMHKMNIETRINGNRKKGQKADETLEECQSEHAQDEERVEQLRNELDAEDELYRQNVEELTGIIDDQRRKIVAHLMGKDEEEEEQPEEDQHSQEEQHPTKDNHSSEEEQPEF
jgi:chromosome segregation ATPase